MATTAKKMSMMQLTVVVAVNMMGSGIIMLPTNMAKVGAISLLSWIVTAIGSMAIAYGFAQAGIFNQRSGGMAAYAEDAFGKDGYFLTFFLYFFSLAIGNVAIAISAVGYLAGFFPGMSATPIATCLSVIGLIWLTTLANFGAANSPQIAYLKTMEKREKHFPGFSGVIEGAELHDGVYQVLCVRK